MTPPNNHGERLGRLEERMQIIEKGVANFNDFKARGNKFFDTYEAEMKAQKETDRRRSRIHFWLLGILSGVIVGCAIALFTWVLNGHHVVSLGVPPQTTADAQLPNLK